MDRRDFLVRGTWAAAGSTRWMLADELASDHQMVSVTIGGPVKQPPIPANFMGLGYEISSIAIPHLLSAANTAYVKLVQQLGSQGVIRVGGNTADYARYRGQAAPVSSPYGTMVNRAALKELGGFLQKTGWQLIWALNLGSASETEAVAEAQAVMAAAGDRLLAFEIGNEPDLFSHEKHRPPGYGYEAWLADYRRYKTLLRKQFPHLPLAGPDVAGKTDWVTRFAADEGKDIVLLTHHYYREGQNPGSTIEKLLGVDPKLQPQLNELRAASASSGIPYRICEVNSFSGGGRPGVSDTMAGALWALDYAFVLAANGCSGVNFETGVNQLGFISSYSPIGDDEHGQCTARPEYYGLLAFARFCQGTLREVAVERKPALLSAYATSAPYTTLSVTLINKGPTASLLRVATGRVTHSHARVIWLRAPAVNAQTGITLGDTLVSPQGNWKPLRQEKLPLRDGAFVIRLPAYSAALVEPGRLAK